MKEERLSRRRLLCGGLAAASLGHPFLLLKAQPATTTGTTATAGDRYPFTLGVASGVPRADGFEVFTHPQRVENAALTEASRVVA